MWQLHDAFGGVNDPAGLGNVMKDLLEIKEAHLSANFA
jgi:hypothetical protein